jgi:hypothetical protein
MTTSSTSTTASSAVTGNRALTVESSDAVDDWSFGESISNRVLLHHSFLQVANPKSPLLSTARRRRRRRRRLQNTTVTHHSYHCSFFDHITTSPKPITGSCEKARTASIAHLISPPYLESSSYISMINEGLGAFILPGPRRSVYTQGTKTATSSTHQTLTRQKGRRADDDEKLPTGCQSRRQIL